MDCTVLDRSLADFSSLTIQEHDNLLTILGLYGMYTLLTVHNICQLVQSIARRQLLDKPMPFVELIKLGIPDVHRDVFWSLLTVPALTTSFNSSSLQHRKSRQSLCLRRSICTRINWTRCISCSILQQFVSRLDQDDLCAFLQFVTGSSVMPRQISVTFNTLAGEMCRPIAHTCANTLELSCTYSSYQEFKREFQAILLDPLNFQMDTV